MKFLFRQRRSFKCTVCTGEKEIGKIVEKRDWQDCGKKRLARLWKKEIGNIVEKRDWQDCGKKRLARLWKVSEGGVTI